MRLTLLVHVIFGGLGLASGYVALAVAKGGPVHRKVGTLFVYVMTMMAITGMLISAVGGAAPAINIPSALLTLYLVMTSLTTVGQQTRVSRRMDIVALVMSLALGVACVALGGFALARGGAEAGLAYPLFLFGFMSFLGGAGDLRVLRDGPLRGVPRLKRHLWRMCFALFVASIAFYAGPGRIPAAIRTPALIATGVLLPIAAMSYWLWRLGHDVRPGRVNRMATAANRASMRLPTGFVER